MKFTVDFLMKKDCFVQTYTLLTVFQLNRQTVILTKINPISSQKNCQLSHIKSQVDTDAKNPLHFNCEKL